MALQAEESSLLVQEAGGEVPASVGAEKTTKPLRRYGLIAGGCGALLLLIVGSPPHNEGHAGMDGVVSLAGKGKCTSGRGNCNTTQCCEGPGLQCFEQNGWYAQCRETCIAGAPDPTHWDGKKWSCKELGTRSQGEPVCGHPGDDCTKSQCCADPGMQCYEKTKGWATCKAECVPDAPDMTDIDGEPWSCRELGERTPSTQDWVAGQCASGWDNCLEKMCCANAGEQCHLQNEGFGECMPVGTCGASNAGDGSPWLCDTAGPQTPGAVKKGGMVPDWALKKCGRLNDGCLESRCCLGMDVACYAKNDDWAMCIQGCEPGKHKDDKNEEWSCDQIGPRSYGLATKGFPSLYCFSVIRVDSYEAEILQASSDRQAGIFACDAYDLLSADAQTTIGDTKSIQFTGAEIVTSIDGTAGNTFLFVNAWNAVIDSGKWRDHAFICKVDPDAVFIPDRVRTHVQAYIAEDMFVINCMVGDMIYGALEVFSYEAIRQWSMRKDECNAPNVLGEDKYMTQCMDTLKATRVHDTGVMGDKLCGTFSSCSDGNNAAFHPFKDVPSWSQCMDEATGGGAPAEQ